MVEIKYIQTTSCPICGNRTIISESVETEFQSEKIREHCSGGRWETRRFSCGYETRYCPNFVREERYGQCKNDASIKERDKRRNEAITNLLEQVDSMNCDDDFKSRLKDKLK